MARPRKDKNHLTTGEAAECLNLSRRTVTKYCIEGRIQAAQHPLTRQWEIDQAALDAFNQNENNVSQKTYKVLVVDDEPSIVRLIRSILSDSNPPIDLDSANDGYQGLLKIGEIAPDLLILDIHMPNMDGNKVLRTLRNEPKTQKISTLVVTGHLDDFHVSARPLADAILEKPFNPKELKECVLKLLGNSYSK